MDNDEQWIELKDFADLRDLDTPKQSNSVESGLEDDGLFIRELAELWEDL